MTTKTDPFVTEIVNNFQAAYGKKVSKEDVNLLNAAYRLGVRKGKVIGEKEMRRKISNIFNRIDLK